MPQRLSDILQPPQRLSQAIQPVQAPQGAMRLSEVLQPPVEAPTVRPADQRAFPGVAQMDRSENTLLNNVLTRPPQFIEEAALKASEAITEPSLDRSKFGAQLRGFAGGAIEGAASLLTPLDVLLGAGGKAVRGIRGVQQARKAERALKAGAPARQAEVAKIVEEGRQLLKGPAPRPAATTINTAPRARPRSATLDAAAQFQDEALAAARRSEVDDIVRQGQELIQPGAAARTRPGAAATPRPGTATGGPQRLQNALEAPPATPTPTRDPIEASRALLGPQERVFRTPEARKALKDPQTFGFSDLNRLLSRTPEEVEEVFGLVEKAGARPDQVRGLREAFAALQAPKASGMAQTIQQAAKQVQSQGGRAFISDVYEQARKNGTFTGTLDDFKDQVLQAHRSGAITGQRTDLVGAFDRAKINRSRTPFFKDSPATEAIDFITDEAGAIGLSTATDLAGAGVGGLLGSAAEADTPEDRVSNALGGALLGFLGVKGARALGRGLRTGAGAKDTALALDSAQLLAGPAAIKASLGGVGAVGAGMAERIATGQPAMAFRMLRYLSTDGPKDYMRVLFTGKGAAEPGRRLFGPTNPVLDVVLRPFKAADTVAARALQHGGYASGEAANLLLTGDPSSKFGQQALSLMRRNFATKLMAKFPTVRIQSLERGIEFSPFGLMKSARLHLRNAPLARGLTEGQRKFRAAAGLGITTGGFGYGLTDPSFKEAGFASALAGPAALPAAVGIGLGKGFRAGGVGEALLTGGSELAFTVPQVGESEVRRFLDFVDPKTGRLTVPSRFRPLPFR